MIGLISMLYVNYLASKYAPKFIYFSILNVIIHLCVFFIAPIVEEYIFYEPTFWIPNILNTCIIFSIAHIPGILLESKFDKYLFIPRLLALFLYRYDISSQLNINIAIFYHIAGNVVCLVWYWWLLSQKYMMTIGRYGIMAISSY